MQDLYHPQYVHFVSELYSRNGQLGEPPCAFLRPNVEGEQHSTTSLDSVIRMMVYLHNHTCMYIYIYIYIHIYIQTHTYARTLISTYVYIYIVFIYTVLLYYRRRNHRSPCLLMQAHNNKPSSHSLNREVGMQVCSIFFAIPDLEF